MQYLYSFVLFITFRLRKLNVLVLIRKKRRKKWWGQAIFFFLGGGGNWKINVLVLIRKKRKMTRASENTISSEKMHTFDMFPKFEDLARSVALFSFFWSKWYEGADEKKDFFCGLIYMDLFPGCRTVTSEIKNWSDKQLIEFT